MKLIPRWKNENDKYAEFIQLRVAQIVAACVRHGYEVSHEHAQTMWQEYSEDVGAGWMMLPSTDDAIVRIILQYAEVVEP